MMPKISIRHNKFLDPIFVGWIKAQPQWKDWKRPSDELIKSQISMYNEEWDKYGERILRGICEATGLNFKRNQIDVYVVSGSLRPFSRPIVIKSGYEPDYFVNVLTHELIHCLYSDNDEEVNKPLHYPHENHTVSVHVYLNAILKYIYIDVLGEPERYELDKKMVADSKLGYNIAWDIVDKIGHLKLIEDFKEKMHEQKKTSR